MDDKFTKGDWKAGMRSVWTQDGTTIICEMPLRDGAKEYEANIDLISAAPNLLKALRSMHKAICDLSNSKGLTKEQEKLLEPSIVLANKATLKARGRG